MYVKYHLTTAARTPPHSTALAAFRRRSSGRFQTLHLDASVRSVERKPTDRSRCSPPPHPFTAVRHRALAQPCRLRERDVFGSNITIVYPVPSSSARLLRRTKRWTLTRVNSSSNEKTTYSSIAEPFESTTGRTLPNRPGER